MSGDGGGVTARDRTRERSLSALERVLQRRAGQRGDDPLREAAGRVHDQFLAEQFLPCQRRSQRLDGVQQDGDHVVASVRQRRVIERTRVLPHPEGLTTDLQHQRLGDGVSDLVRRGDAEAGFGKPDDVLVGSGERHRGVNGQRNATMLGERCE